MIDRADFVTSVRRSWESVKQFELGETVRQFEPLPVIPEFRDLALGGADRYADLFAGGYRTGAYNIVLRDFSLLQFGSDRVGLRYAFLPNPYITLAASGKTIDEAWDLVNGGASSLEEAIDEIGGLGTESGVPLIRYEVAESQWVPLRHPFAHFHIGFHSENRWPVSRILTPLAFTLFIVKMYYANEWLVGCVQREASRFERRLRDEREANCRIVSPEFFPDDERRSFHFA